MHSPLLGKEAAQDHTQDPWDVPQHLVTAPDVCYGCPGVLTTWWHASGCFLGRAPRCSPRLQGLPPFPTRASRALCLGSQELGKGLGEGRDQRGARDMQAAGEQRGARRGFGSSSAAGSPQGSRPHPQERRLPIAAWRK